MPACTLHTRSLTPNDEKVKFNWGIRSHLVRAKWWPNAHCVLELRVTFPETSIHWIAAEIHYHFIYSRARQLFTFHVADKQLYYANSWATQNHSYFDETIFFSSSSRSFVVFANCKSILFVALAQNRSALDYTVPWRARIVFFSFSFFFVPKVFVAYARQCCRTATTTPPKSQSFSNLIFYCHQAHCFDSHVSFIYFCSKTIQKWKTGT